MPFGSEERARAEEERVRVLFELAELAAADRRKNEFLATLAHELRNPLAPLRHALHLLQVAGDDPGIRLQAGGVMERQLGKLVQLVDDLLDASRISSNKLQLKKERIELAAAVQSAVETARPLIAAAGHDLKVTLPAEPVYLDADLNRLAQVFTNLLNNAAKYTDPGGRVRLVAESQGDEVAVSVRDTGIGIAAAHLPHLFEIFSQVSPDLERSAGGLGIGLSLVRGLVALHGGAVEARSNGLGQGSEFLVRLPLAATPKLAPRPAPEEEEPLRSGPTYRILIADDNKDTVESLGLLLELSGYEVQMAYDGLQAVQEAASFFPQVALLDIGMPRHDGYEAARQIRQQPWGKDMVLIAVTGWGQESDKQQALAAGFDHHLTKPVEPADLKRLLGSITVPK